MGNMMNRMDELSEPLINCVATLYDDDDDDDDDYDEERRERKDF